MTDGSDEAPEKMALQVSEIGEFVRFQSCLRRAKLAFNRREEARQLPFYARLENTLDVVLRDRGLTIEESWEDQLIAQDYNLIAQGERGAAVTFEDVLDMFSQLPEGSKAFGREIAIAGDAGAFRLEGRMDFVVLLWRDGIPFIRIVEGKASRRDKTYQRMQTAAYLRLADAIVQGADYSIGGNPITASSLEAVVARFDEDLREPQNILELQPLDLTIYLQDLAKLLSDGGAFDIARASGLDDLPYRLEAKCDACVFNVHCLPESSRRRDIRLIGVPDSSLRALELHGIINLDQLAELDDDQIISEIRNNDQIDEDPLRLKAKAIARRKQLPGGNNLDGFVVEPLPMSGRSSCPEHVIDGEGLVRIFLNLDYDYVEDRVASVSAYVVRSENRISTPFREQVDGWRPAPEAIEINAETNEEAPLSGRKVTQFKSTAWTGDPAEDSAAERQLLESFFQELIEAIAEVGGGEAAPIHFYVWSSSELTNLMEACARGGASLIRHFSELLGCRQGREQLIVTSLQSDVHRMFGLGWTGRGLSVISSLRWFGKRFHWSRSVRGAPAQLDRIFEQDIFDFATTLHSDGTNWVEADNQDAILQRHEVRARFNDSVPMPYFAVIWGQLNSADAKWDNEPLVRAAIRRYEEVRTRPGLLRAYLEARCEALRFIEENLRKNRLIDKHPLDLQNLGAFLLGVDSPRAAALDVLRIDWQVRLNEWLAAQVHTASERCANGRCLPIQNVTHDGRQLTATIAAEAVNLDRATLQRRYSEGNGSFVRIMPWSGNPEDTSGVGAAFTCVIDTINWQTGRVELSAMFPQQAAHYRQYNAPVQDFEFALLEQSATDYVAPKVETRLSTVGGNHIDPWFNLNNPIIPPAVEQNDDRLEAVERGLARWRMPERPESGLHAEQIEAAMAGMQVNLQALQGPPGTGKTATTAAAIRARAAAELSAGDRIIVAGPTHRAVDTVTERLARWEPSLRLALAQEGVEPPPLRIIRLDPRDDCDLEGPIALSPVPSTVGASTDLICDDEAITVICGTTNALLKLEEKLGRRTSIDAKLLVVDEASMMVFPHMLSIATLTDGQPKILVAGDNRQLAPILAHGWDKEDRPPTVRFQPFLSSYEVVALVNEAIRGRLGAERMVGVNRLRHTYRLPPSQRRLIGLIYQAHDGIELEGRADDPGGSPADANNPFSEAWTEPKGLVLILHDERSSRKENALERCIIRELLAAHPDAPDGSIALLSPHRGQRGLLQEELGQHPAIRVIYTVERLQGGEAPTVIVTATASDPGQIQTAEDFLLNLNRSNVAFSRAEERLIVIASAALLDHIAADLEIYEAAMLWKEVRRLCSVERAEIALGNHTVKIMSAAD